MKLDRDILKQLPLALRVEIEENAQRKPLAQSELAAQQRRILQELRKHTTPGRRTDLATSENNLSEVTRATQCVGRLYGESHKQVEKRLAVVAAAEAEPERFAVLVEEMDRTGKVDKPYAELRRIETEERETIPAPSGGIRAEVITGDFRIEGHAVADASTDLVFTDPEYAREYVAKFADLAQFAARVLVEGGSLITYFGTRMLPEVLQLITPHLRYHWLCTVSITGGKQTFPGKSVGVQIGHKPLLWFTKGTRRTSTTVADHIKSERGNKVTGHKWAQGETEATHFIKYLSRPGSLIVDPFCGSATTGIAALKGGRRFVGFEIVPETARKARARIARLQGARAVP